MPKTPADETSSASGKIKNLTPQQNGHIRFIRTTWLDFGSG
jgi:hypothetical protein